MADMIGVFANFERDVLKERVKAGIADTKRRGVQFGRPKAIKAQPIAGMKALSASVQTHLEVAKRFGIGRTSVFRLLGPSTAKPGRRTNIAMSRKADESPQQLIINFLCRLASSYDSGV